MTVHMNIVVDAVDDSRVHVGIHEVSTEEGSGDQLTKVITFTIPAENAEQLAGLLLDCAQTAKEHHS